MAAVTLLANRVGGRATALAIEAIAWLSERGHEVRVPATDAEQCGLDRWAVPDEQAGAGCALALSLGGDGTMLRTVELVAAAGVPIIGVNVGHLGYLTEVEANGLLPALERFFAGDFTVEERMSLEVCVTPAGASVPTEHRHALNEAVLQRISGAHTVRLEVWIAGRFFTTYVADGLIVATPTGSTAYNLSARGPICSPALRALCVTPVSPHMLFDRALVLDPSQSIALTLVGSRPAEVVADGRAVAVLEPGDTVECRAGSRDVRLVRFRPTEFHQILKAKFGLADL